MHPTKQREAFRAILDGETCIQPASVFDPLSARIAYDLGFEAGIFAGSVASMVILGAPDLSVMTFSEFADQAKRINRAAALPLLVDADHGYGNALKVMRTVEELEIAGVAALSIEDTLLPSPFGDPDTPQMISLEEGVGKMRAALKAREDKTLVICGRTSATKISDVDDAVARLKAYEEAGVDALFVVGVFKRADLDRIADAVGLPLIVGHVGDEVRDLDYLASRGVRVCLQSHAPFYAGVQAVYESLKALRNGVSAKDLKGAPAEELMDMLSRGSDYRRWIEDFLKPKSR